nr:MAG TPA: hypothetical protein [Caudoviricetes sp.]
MCQFLNKNKWRYRSIRRFRKNVVNFVVRM